MINIDRRGTTENVDYILQSVKMGLHPESMAHREEFTLA